jgi:hypothetical protein
MIIDSAAIDNSSKACNSKFASFAPGLKSSNITCVMQPYVAFALIDATLFLALLYLGLVLYHVYRRFLMEAKQAKEAEARKPASERLSEEQKRQMFAKGDEEENSSLPPGIIGGGASQGAGAAVAASSVPKFE